MGWKDARKHAQERPEFVSLKMDGQIVEFIGLTEPTPAKKPGFDRGTTRDVYRVHVYVPGSGAVKANTLDLSLRQFEAYADSVGEGHELKDVVRMTRHGSANDQNTTYTFQVVRKAKASELAAAKTASKTIVNV